MQVLRQALTQPWTVLLQWPRTSTPYSLSLSLSSQPLPRPLRAGVANGAESFPYLWSQFQSQTCLTGTSCFGHPSPRTVSNLTRARPQPSSMSQHQRPAQRRHAQHTVITTGHIIIESLLAGKRVTHDSTRSACGPNETMKERLGSCR